jgi:hypothetical protein
MLRCLVVRHDMENEMIYINNGSTVKRSMYTNGHQILNYLRQLEQRWSRELFDHVH